MDTPTKMPGAYASSTKKTVVDGRGSSSHFTNFQNDPSLRASPLSAYKAASRTYHSNQSFGTTHARRTSMSSTSSSAFTSSSRRLGTPAVSVSSARHSAQKALGLFTDLQNPNVISFEAVKPFLQYVTSDVGAPLFSITDERILLNSIQGLKTERESGILLADGIPSRVLFQIIEYSIKKLYYMYNNQKMSLSLSSIKAMIAEYNSKTNTSSTIGSTKPPPPSYIRSTYTNNRSGLSNETNNNGTEKVYSSRFRSDYTAPSNSNINGSTIPSSITNTTTTQSYSLRRPSMSDSYHLSGRFSSSVINNNVSKLNNMETEKDDNNETFQTPMKTLTSSRSSYPSYNYLKNSFINNNNNIDSNNNNIINNNNNNDIAEKGVSFETGRRSEDSIVERKDPVISVGASKTLKLISETPRSFAKTRFEDNNNSSNNIESNVKGKSVEENKDVQIPEAIPTLNDNTVKIDAKTEVPKTKDESNNGLLSRKEYFKSMGIKDDKDTDFEDDYDDNDLTISFNKSRYANTSEFGTPNQFSSPFKRSTLLKPTSFSQFASSPKPIRISPTKPTKVSPQKDMDHLSQNMSTLQQKIMEAEKRFEDADRKKHENRIRINELEYELQSIKEDRDKISREFNTTERLLKQKVLDLENDLVSKKNYSSEEHEQIILLEKEISNVRHKYNDILKDLDEKSEEIQNLHKKLRERDSDFKNIQQDLVKAETRIKGLTSDFQDAWSSLSSAKRENERLKDELNDLKDELRERDRLDEVERKLNQQGQSMTDGYLINQSIYGTNSNEINRNSFNSDILTKEEEKELREQLSEILLKIDNVNKENSYLSSKINIMRKEIDLLNNRADSIKEKSLSIESKYEQFKSTLLNSDIDKVSEIKKIFTEQINKTKEDLNRAKKDYEDSVNLREKILERREQELNESLEKNKNLIISTKNENKVESYGLTHGIAFVIGILFFTFILCIRNPQKIIFEIDDLLRDDVLIQPM